jgi:hypothetical protein
MTRTDLLQRGRDVETFETPEDSTPVGYHGRTFATHLKLDARGRSVG